MVVVVTVVTAAVVVIVMTKLSLHLLFVVQITNHAFIVRISYMEIYNEKLTDLLNSAAELNIMESTVCFIFSFRTSISIMLHCLEFSICEDCFK